MIYTQLRVFASFFLMMSIKASAIIGQVVEVNFAFETNKNDFEILVGEVQIQSKWTGVEVLSNNYVWEFVSTDAEDFTITRNLDKPWRVVRGPNTGEWFAQFRAPKYRISQNLIR